MPKFDIGKDGNGETLEHHNDLIESGPSWVIDERHGDKGNVLAEEDNQKEATVELEDSTVEDLVDYILNGGHLIDLLSTNLLDDLLHHLNKI